MFDSFWLAGVWVVVCVRVDV